MIDAATEDQLCVVTLAIMETIVRGAWLDWLPGASEGARTFSGSSTSVMVLVLVHPFTVLQSQACSTH